MALAEISRLVERKLIQPFVERTYYPEEVESAIAASEITMGRILIRIE